MNTSKRIWFARAVTIAKIIGVILLTVHIIREDTPFRIVWVGAYVFLTFFMLFIFVMITAIIDKIRYKLRPQLKEEKQKDYYKRVTILRQHLRREPWQIPLIPGEDGFFFLPLLYIGITPLSAAIASAIFAAAHLNYKSIRGCIFTFITQLVLCLEILPLGILAFAVGHFLIDAFAIPITLISRQRMLKQSKAKDELSGQTAPTAETE